MVGPTIMTDKADYAPGTPVHFTGSGWIPGVAVTISMTESPLVDQPEAIVTMADSAGNISDTSFAPDIHDIGIKFYVTATQIVQDANGKDTVLTAQTDFTDSVTSVTITSPTTASPVTITSLPATFTVAFSYVTSSTGTTIATADVVGTGVSATQNIPSGSGSATIVVTVPSGTTNGTYNLKVTLTNTDGTGSNNKNDNTNGAVIVNVNACAAPSITSQPTNQTVTYGNNATFTTAAGSSNVQWQSSTDGASWVNVSGATSTTLTITQPSVSQSGTQYRAVFSSTCSPTQTATSNAATLTVNPRPITVTADAKTKVYGDADPALTYQLTSGTLVARTPSPVR